jgi:hypothetical protein
MKPSECQKRLSEFEKRYLQSKTVLERREEGTHTHTHTHTHTREEGTHTKNRTRDEGCQKRPT